METIHVVYGARETNPSVRAYNLAVERMNAFVHEIDGREDVRMILASRYRHCIAVLDAGDEMQARNQMNQLAAEAALPLCPVTFEAASHLA